MTLLSLRMSKYAQEVKDSKYKIIGDNLLWYIYSVIIEKKKQVK